MKRLLYTSIIALVFSVNALAQAVLPTSWSFATTTLPMGWTESGTAFYSASGNTPPAMKFDNTGDYLIINFGSAPGALTYFITGNSFSGGTFTVEESDLGVVWTTLHTFTSPPAGTYTQFTDAPLSATRFIRFIYTNKSAGNIGLDDVSIDAGVAGPEQEINVLQGSTTILSGGTYALSSPVATMTPTTFTIANEGTVNTLNIASAVISGSAAADYSVASVPATVASGSTENLVLNFTPSIAGTRTAVLTIASNDSDESAYVINLYGIGGSYATEPSTQASALTLSNVKTYRLNGSFVASPSAEGYIVLRKTGSAITGVPADGMVYQRGDNVGDAQVVFSGNSTSFVPNNIIASTNYYFAVYAYNGNGIYRNYLTSSAATANVTTPATMVSGTQYNGINTAAATFISDLHNLTNPHQMQFYSNYGNLMVKQFATRDTVNDQRVVTCVYSGENKVYSEPFDFTSNNFSREHTYCNSWMPNYPNNSPLPEYNDYHHLFPTNQNQVNALRSNYPLGIVATVTQTYQGCKYGLDVNGNTVFEPRDEHKGDAARAMFYETVSYTSVGGNLWNLPTYISTFVPYGQDQAILKQWNTMDPPNKWEIARNDYIDSLQGNRNPFVDHPEYACFIDFSTMTYLPDGCNTGIQELGDLSNSLFVYPVPTSTELHVGLNNTEITAYSIVDVLGRVITSASNLNNVALTLNVANLKSGTYFIKVTTAKGLAQKQFVIQ